MALSTTARLLCRLAVLMACCTAQVLPSLAQTEGQPPESAGISASSPITLNPPRRLEWVGVPKRKPASKRKAPPKDAQMLVQADEMRYDYANDRIAAIGNVQIYYAGATLEADRVIYDQKTKRLRAEGSVRLVDVDSAIVNGEIIDLDAQFRDGFVDSLRLETPDKTHLAAPRAERAGADINVLHSAVYTACEPCKDDPRKPPKWQVKAVRIVHDELKKMLYFENARLEFFGVPLFWLPYFSVADPTVKRKSGWLMATPSYSKNYGFAIGAPYFWALAPNYDLTLTPIVTTQQGPMLEAEWRHRLESGGFTVHGAGIVQLDPGAFVKNDGVGYPGARQFRGEADTSGRFSLNDQWVWGWNGLVVTDRMFFQDYKVNGYWQHFTGTLNTGNGMSDAGDSQLYLFGRGDQSYFDGRLLYFYGLSLADVQSQLPVVHPVIDYARVFGEPLLGGELSFRGNITSLSRQSADFDPVSQYALATNACMTADPKVLVAANCLLRGVPGTYSRVSAETTWRRTFIDPLGETWTPFASLRGDLAEASITNQPGVANFVETGNNTFARSMPAVGFEYRYPWIGVQSWGTQTVQPIVQVIARPNEPDFQSPNQKMPNEDSQSLVFDDSNLFKVDKFVGWDRVEGGGRANYGVEYTAQFNQGGTVNALFGESAQLFGANSFAYHDSTSTGLDSGLQTPLSDYVARLSYQPDQTYSFISRFRLSQSTFEVQRAEVEARANFDRWSVSMLYGDHAPQPDIGFLTRRDGVLGTASVKFTPNWSILGGARYDINAGDFDQYRIGLGYIDECLAITVNYATSLNYGYSPASPTNPLPIAVSTDHAVMLQMSLRTLATTGFSTRVGSTGPN
jgi:LPS-assembly protein